MPRTPRLRKIVAPPLFEGYKPYGNGGSEKKEPVRLLYEEYEAIKLADYDLMDHKAASQIMGVSRPTFARIYENARRKIAKAMVEVRTIKTEYGNAWMDKNWLLCNNCRARFSTPNNANNEKCALCGSIDIEPISKQNC
ncbi:DUF134 domain-containing protein [Marinilabiliaceae bacterium ANBcel2]|nr:DUF134 domain-containing protein [Marinilabiliaceae bacterium ANBcel2]